jgi:hypothetical protein
MVRRLLGRSSPAPTPNFNDQPQRYR